MNRDNWERQFKHLLKQQLGIEPEQIQFHWHGYYNQRFLPEGAVAHVKQTHRLYPQLGLLPENVTTEA